MAPATHPTGPVRVPVAADASVKTKTVEHKDKKKAHKSRKTDDSADKDIKTETKADKKCESKSHKKRDLSTLLALKHSASTKQGRSGSPLAVASFGPESAKQLDAEKIDIHQPPSSSDQDSTGPTGHTSSF